MEQYIFRCNIIGPGLIGIHCLSEEQNRYIRLRARTSPPKICREVFRFVLLGTDGYNI